MMINRLHVFALRQTLLQHILDRTSKCCQAPAPRTSLQQWAEAVNIHSDRVLAQPCLRALHSSSTGLHEYHHSSRSSGFFHHQHGHEDHGKGLEDDRRPFTTLLEEKRQHHKADRQRHLHADIISNLKRPSQRAANLEEATRLHSMHEWPVREYSRLGQHIHAPMSST